MKKLLETVPNYSEGRDMEKVAKIAACFKNRKGVRLLDCQTDANHNRCVITAVGEPEALKNAVLDSFGVAVAEIDLTHHEGQHPRMGAVDVVPFIPCRNTTVEEADAIAKELGKEVGEKYGVPVFLYEDSASAPHRQNLAKIRKGQFEGMAEKMQDKELWTPDFGPDHIHPTAGVVAIGARMPLIAFNINLDTDNMEIANAIANAVKNIRGGYHFIKAIGVELNDHYTGRPTVAQVSMNLVNYQKTAVYRAFEAVKMEARRYGVNVIESEIVGVVPMECLIDCAAYYLQACCFGPMKFDPQKQIMENWLLEDEEEEN
ncbi:MAG: glutamate formimidoyltransferase [Bacillota bacterium]|uniref:glutamate formimidoyltransferase n=1 Tax=[Clostridium] aminophilum TaxID=1526 RepID=A0A1I6IEA1_9FIRM|nr:glutamate formimidoyltransferase [[Clostridium] aminophilum]MCR4628239.1 glutamate formimidoyltransferase [Clostridium sp.]MDT3844531.1 glutamate formimidoyltransferase [Bacillota bacterium]SFR64680.1 glutamate formiminotransferase [[Clostridium] aminophilum]